MTNEYMPIIYGVVEDGLARYASFGGGELPGGTVIGGNGTLVCEPVTATIPQQNVPSTTGTLTISWPNAPTQIQTVSNLLANFGNPARKRPAVARESARARALKVAHDGDLPARAISLRGVPVRGE